MGIKFLCEGASVWMLLSRTQHMTVPSVDETIYIEDTLYLVTKREWMADSQGIHVTILLSRIPIPPR